MPSAAEEASWRHLHPASRVLLWYEGDTLWHERMLLAATCEDQSEWVIVTPDSDIHYESFRADVSRVIVLPDGGVRPPLNDPVHGFAEGGAGSRSARALAAGYMGRTEGAIENATWLGGGHAHGRQDWRSPEMLTVEMPHLGALL